MRKHLVIPDTQVAPGTPTAHLSWIGQYIVDKKPDVVMNLGDFWDMPALCSYDRLKPRKMEGRRVVDDIEAGNVAMDVLMEPLRAEQERQRRNKEKIYKPELHFILGNHEERIERAVDDDPYQLEGVLGYDLLNLADWTVHPFLEIADIDGVWYSHYFYNQKTGKPLGSQPMTRLKDVGHTFTMGHQQGLQEARRTLADGTIQRAIIAGSCYLHRNDYMGPQGDNDWSGILVKHEVRDGQYDLMEVSLDYLCRRYEGVTLGEFL